VRRWRRQRWRQAHPGRVRRAAAPLGAVLRVVAGWPGAWLIGLLVVVAVWLAGSGGPADPSLGPPMAEGPPVVYAALGGPETMVSAADPLGGYAMRLTLSDFPLHTTHLDLAAGGGSLDELAGEPLAAALDARPDVVTVLVGPGDARVGTPIDRFGSDLGTLVRALHAAGASQVLVGVAPAADVAPEVLAPYEEAVRAVAVDAGAVFVDIGAALDPGALEGGVLTPSGHDAIARALSDMLAVPTPRA